MFSEETLKQALDEIDAIEPGAENGSVTAIVESGKFFTRIKDTNPALFKRLSDFLDEMFLQSVMSGNAKIIWASVFSLACRMNQIEAEKVSNPPVAA